MMAYMGVLEPGFDGVLTGKVFMDHLNRYRTDAVQTKKAKKMIEVVKGAERK
jgi:hypothetical protein